MSNRLPGAIALALCVFSIAGVTPAAAGPLRILQHEAVRFSEIAGVGANERISFEAYGRRFDLELEVNERISAALEKSHGRVRPLRGRVAGMPGSWVRITRGPHGWSGMFYDGIDLYGVEPAGDLADAAVQPLPERADAPVVFRLADAIVSDEAALCATAIPSETSERRTALSVYESLGSELSSHAGSMSPNRRVRVGVVADYEFVRSFRDRDLSPEEAIAARMNIVDGIFSSQIGVKVELASTTLYTDSADPFYENDARDLLDELRTYRRNSPTQRALGITHLMTGRDMHGETVGIAYLGSVCDYDTAASLSEGTRSTTSAALIVAHELGHNFNAPHDGEGACATVPHSFIMSPRLNGSDQFSACSINQMKPTVAAARCLTHYSPPDTALEVTTGTLQGRTETAITASFNVRAIGEEPSLAVVASATLPPGLTLETATAGTTACLPGAGGVSCEIGTLSPGEGRQIDLRLVGADPGTFSLELAVTSQNESSTTNNSGAITITLTKPGSTVPPTGESTLDDEPKTAGGSSGGGGCIDLAMLLLLAGVMAMRARRYRTAEHTGVPVALRYVPNDAIPLRLPLIRATRRSSMQW